MKNRTNITITGDLGSGKSLLSEHLIKALGIEYISTGQIQRKVAMEHNMTTLELNKLAEKDKSIDKEIDDQLVILNTSPKSHIVDSRLAWFFIPDSFKIYLKTNIEIAAKRILNDKERNGEKYETYEKAIKDIRLRKESENYRFLKYYGADCSDMQNFDIVIDSSYTPASVLSDFILFLREQHLKNQPVNRYWISPKNLYPTQSIRTIARDDAKEIKDLIQEKGFDNSYPIEAVYFNEKIFIVDGHKRTSGALFANINLIPVQIINDFSQISKGLTTDMFVKDSWNQSSIYDWEDCHNFRFDSYLEIEQ